MTGMEKTDSYNDAPGAAGAAGAAGLDAELEAQLMSHLASCGRSGGYRVVEVLKRSDFEVTEKVEFVGESAGNTGEAAVAMGPFVRKRIDAAAGLGGAYELLFIAQRRGLRCPNLPRIIDCWNDSEAVNVVMEWLDGETLEERVARLGPSADLAREAVAQVGRAVDVLHGGLGAEAPVIHRDLKPANVMVVGGEQGIPATYVLIDLGIARTWREGATADTARLGTRSYAPPEQFGFGQTSVRSDVYALGAILYFCLTGEDPAAGKTADELAREKGLPAELAAVVARAMSFDPKDRYASARELARAVAGEGNTASDQRRVSCQQSQAVRQRPILPRVPDSLGRAWNTALWVTFAIVVAACVANFVQPRGASAKYPGWFLGFEFLFWMPISFAAAAYLVMDKRRLFQKVPTLAAVPIGRQRLACLAVIAGSLLIVMFAGYLGGAF